MTCSIFLATVGFIQTLRVIYHEQTVLAADQSEQPAVPSKQAEE